MLYLPGIDGTGLAASRQFPFLVDAFDLHCLSVPSADRTPFPQLISLIECAFPVLACDPMGSSRIACPTGPAHIYQLADLSVQSVCACSGIPTRSLISQVAACLLTTRKMPMLNHKKVQQSNGCGGIPSARRCMEIIVGQSTPERQESTFRASLSVMVLS